MSVGEKLTGLIPSGVVWTGRGTELGYGLGGLSWSVITPVIPPGTRCPDPTASLTSVSSVSEPRKGMVSIGDAEIRNGMVSIGDAEIVDFVVLLGRKPKSFKVTELKGKVEKNERPGQNIFPKLSQYQKQP